MEDRIWSLHWFFKDGWGDDDRQEKNKASMVVLCLSVIVNLVVNDNECEGDDREEDKCVNEFNEQK